MANPSQFPLDKYLIEQPDPTKLPKNLICIDDRFVLRHIIGWQIGGGPDGLGRDLIIAREMEKPSSFTDLNEPVHWLGAKVARKLEAKGTQALMHHECAAYMAALVIRRSICEEPQAIFKQTQHMGADITESEMQQSVEASARILKHDLIKPTEESDPDLLKGVETSDTILPPVARVTLVRGPHMANDFIVDHGTDVLWNAEEAFRAGHPAYYYGLGILRNAHPLFENFVSYRSLYVASVVRHAAISLKLPRPNNQPLIIHTRGNDQ